MMHVVQKWTVIVQDSQRKTLNKFDIDSDFLSEVLSVISKINFGIAVDTISILKHRVTSGAYTNIAPSALSNFEDTNK